MYVKETFPGNGRFHVTLDPDVSAEDVARMKNATQRKKARFARRKDVADLVEGEEVLGGIVRVREGGLFDSHLSFTFPGGRFASTADGATT